MIYDIIIIGAGPGGYVAAERAGEKGKKILLIEKDTLGGVCLNWGCIPTKSLLNSAKLYKQAKNSREQGVIAGEVKFDLAKAMAWKNQTVETLVNGIGFLMKKNKVDVLQGEARIKSPSEVELNGTIYQGKAIIIATGSSAIIPPIPGGDLPHVHTNRGVLSLEKLPQRVVIVGGGVIGMEFASFFSSLEISTAVVEMLPSIIPAMDPDLSRLMQRAMDHVDFYLDSRVTAIGDNHVEILLKDKKQNLKADLVLMSVGRKPNIQNLGLEDLKLDFTPKGIAVNQYMETNIPGIYAIGDVTGKSLLAHSASRMGEVAVNRICGTEDEMSYKAIPWAVYTQPEAAGCGMNELEAKAQGYDIRTIKYQFAANGRFLAEKGKSPGRCKVVIDKNSDRILGIHMLGAYSTELIFGAAMILHKSLHSHEIKEMIFPHPTVSEVIREAMFQ